MSVTDIERAAVPGALDSNLLDGESPISAKALREVIRTANFMRDAGATMLTASFPPLAAADRLIAPTSAKLLYVWRVPSRTAHTQADVRIRSLISSSGVLRFTARTSRTSVLIEAAGTGSVTTYTGTLPLESAEYQTVEIWAESLTGVTAGSIGTPTSWNSGTNVTTIFQDGVEVTTDAWDDAELSTGDYVLAASIGGVEFTRKPISRVVANQIVMGELFTAAEFSTLAAATSIDFEITQRVPFEVRSVLVRGVP